MSFPDELTTLTDEDGEIDRALPQRVWSAPSDIRIEGGRLVWRALGVRPMSPGHGMLTGFVALAEAGPDQILAYAGRWGVLGLCSRHGRPMTGLIGSMHGKARDHLNCGFERENSESIRAWRRLARLVRSLLLIADALDDPGELKAPHRWRGFNPSVRAGLPAEPAAARRDAEELLRRIVWRLLAVANVGIGPDWRPGGPLVTGGYGLLGALALETASIMSGTAPFAMCSACSRPFRPTRRPSPGRRRYCPDCQASKQDRRDSQTDWRRRQVTPGDAVAQLNRGRRSSSSARD